MSLVSDITGQILAAGQARAAGQRRSGEIWGQTLANIGQTIGALPGQIQQAKIGEQEQKIRAQEMELRQSQMNAAKRAQAVSDQSDAIVSNLMTQQPDGTFTPDRAKLTAAFTQSKIPIEQQAKWFKHFDDIDASMGKFAAQRSETIADTANSAIKSIKDGADPDSALAFAIALTKANHPNLGPEHFKPIFDALAKGGDPVQVLTTTRDALSSKYKDADKPIVVPSGGLATTPSAIQEAGGTLANPRPAAAPTRATLAVAAANPDPAISAPAKAALAAMKTDATIHVGSFEDYVARYAAAKGKTADSLTTADIEDARKRYQQADDRPRITVNTGNASDVKEVVAGMKDGTLPPQLPGRASKEYSAIMAEAHRQHYNLAEAASDWTATQKHLATLNGAQQTRLRQAIGTATDSLDVIQSLADKWKGGRFPVLNKANLAAAKNGVYGKDAASIATQLEGQITDVTAELANVYMGGNSPTDHALKLAEKNLRADWDLKVLTDMIGLARTNLNIRSNSILHSGAITSSSQQAPATPAALPQWTVDASGHIIPLKPK